MGDGQRVQIKKKLETVLKKCPFLLLLRSDGDKVGSCGFSKTGVLMYGCPRCELHKGSLQREAVKLNLTGVQNYCCLELETSSLPEGMYLPEEMTYF